MRTKRLLYYFLLAFTTVNVIYSQDVSVRAEFDTSGIFIGDQVHFTVTIDQPSDIALNVESHKDSIIKNIEIVSGPVTDTLKVENGKIKILKKYLVTSFDTGFYQVPPEYAEIKNENGIKRFYSDYARLRVSRVSIAPRDTTAKIFDIVGPYKAPVTLGEILPWILIVFLGAALVYFLVRFLKKIKKEVKHEEVNIPREPAHVIAFRDLEKLKSEQLWQKGEVKNYYSRLTEIIRQYLENRYGVYSLELTTSETLEELARTGFKKDERYIMLKEILTGSDLVKFAKYKPEPSENELHFENSWRFVNITRVIPEHEVNKEESEKQEGKVS